MQPEEAIDTLINTLTSIIPDLPESNAPYRANPDAARFFADEGIAQQRRFSEQAESHFC